MIRLIFDRLLYIGPIELAFDENEAALRSLCCDSDPIIG